MLFNYSMICMSDLVGSMLRKNQVGWFQIFGIMSFIILTTVWYVKDKIVQLAKTLKKKIFSSRHKENAEFNKMKPDQSIEDKKVYWDKKITNQLELAKRLEKQLMDQLAKQENML